MFRQKTETPAGSGAAKSRNARQKCCVKKTQSVRRKDYAEKTRRARWEYCSEKMRRDCRMITPKNVEHPPESLYRMRESAG